jgi:hypothetical protein
VARDAGTANLHLGTRWRVTESGGFTSESVHCW